MPLSIVQHPPSVHYARDNAWFRLLASAGPPSNAFAFLNVTAGMTAGDTLELTYFDITLQFVVSASVTGSGLDLPTQQTGQTLGEYADLVAERFRENATLSSSFDVSRSTNNLAQELVILRASDPLIDNLAVPTLPSGIALASLSNPNLNAPVVTALIQCSEIGVLGEITPLGRRSGQVNTDREVEFDLAESIDLEATPPPSSIVSNMDIVRVDGPSMLYELRYAMQEGLPPVADRFVKYDTGSIDSLVAVHGRTPSFGYQPVRDQTNTLPVRILTAVDVEREVMTSQPSFRYILATSNNVSPQLQLRVEVYHGIGVPTIFTVDLGAHTFEKGRTYVVPTGFSQLGLNTMSVAEDITHYRVFLFSGALFAKLGDYTIMRECPDQIAYVAIDNQLGGCDTIMLQGQQQWGLPVRGNPIAVPATSAEDFAISEGGREGQQVIDCSTGHISTLWAQHLAGALPARCWVLSGDNWIPAYAEKTEQQYFDTYENLQALPMRITLAKPQS